MRIVRSAAELGGPSAVGGETVFVPTMGALHAGHAALVTRGAAEARARGLRGGCVVSVFVNPTQFDDPRDLERYPRTLDADAALCQAAGAQVLYAPPVADVYPPGVAIPAPPLPEPAAGRGLEDAARPGHFAGVCQVVRRLFDLVRPAAAIFGEKDWQQLVVIAAMTRRDGLGIDILPGPTVREPDGLAMSSRNRFLGPDDRARALSLFRALRAAARVDSPAAAEAQMRRELIEAGVDRIDYAAVRDAVTLGPARVGSPCRALIAARVGAVRLLDNASWPAGPDA